MYNLRLALYLVAKVVVILPSLMGLSSSAVLSVPTLNFTAETSHTAANNTPSIAPSNGKVEFRESLSYDDQTASSGAKSHGKVSMYRGNTYKWHQIALEVWQGIPLEEWQDATHVKNDTPLSFFDSDSTFSSKKPNPRDSDLSIRDLGRRLDFDERCRAIRLCVARELTALALQLSLVLQYLTDALSPFGLDIWDLLHRPVVLLIHKSLINVASTVYAWTEGSIKDSECSSEQSDADTIKSIGDDQSSDQPYRAIKASIPNGSNSANITIDVTPHGQVPDGVCGLPPSPPMAIGQALPSGVIPEGMKNFTNVPAASPIITPGMRSYMHLKRLVFTRYEYLGGKISNYALQCLRFLFETMIEHAADIASQFSRDTAVKTWLRSNDFDLDIGNSDGTPLTSDHFKDFATTMLGAMSAGFLGSVAGYMFLDMPYVLNFDLHPLPKRIQIEV